MTNQLTPLATIGALLSATVAVTIIDSYMPHELIMVRQILSGVQLILMLATAGVTVRSLLKDF